MLSRLVTHSCRGLSHSANNFALFQQTVTQSCRGLSHSAKNVAQQKATRETHGITRISTDLHVGAPGAVRRRRNANELPPNVNNSMALAGVSAFGLAALAYYGKQLSKEETDVDSTTFPQYVRDRMTSAHACKLAGVAVVLLSTIAASRSTALMKFAASLSAGRKITMGLCSLVAISLSATLCDSKPVGWWIKHVAIGVPFAAFCVGGGALAFVGIQLGSAGFAVGLSIAAMTAPSENFLLTKSGPLAMGLGFACVYGIVRGFLPPLSSLGARLRVFVCVMLVLEAAVTVSRAQHEVKSASEIPRLFNSYDYGLM